MIGFHLFFISDRSPLTTAGEAGLTIRRWKMARTSYPITLVYEEILFLQPGISLVLHTSVTTLKKRVRSLVEDTHVHEMHVGPLLPGIGMATRRYAGRRGVDSIGGPQHGNESAALAPLLK